MASPREGPAVTVQPRFTSADLDLLPQSEFTRYEIIDGELYVSKQPHYYHQYARSQIHVELELWNRQFGHGVVLEVPGLVFDDGNDVIPDVVWLSHSRRERALDNAGHFSIAPELVIEVLSYGSRNEKRDQEAKLKLYSVRGVHEYWIVDWRGRQVQVYRRQEAALQLVTTLEGADTITSPLLPGFALPTTRLWEPSTCPSPAQDA
jgi:Uma2 family endonuclease